MSPVKITELEGDSVFNDDHYFVKIGEPVPLKANDSDFNVETLPSQPLALSERFRLTFVAHSSGKLKINYIKLNTHFTSINLCFFFMF